MPIDPHDKEALARIRARIGEEEWQKLVSSRPSPRPPGHQRGVPSSTRKFEDGELVAVFFDWADELPPEDLPPSEKAFARYAGCSPKTVYRALGPVGIADWDHLTGLWMRSRLSHGPSGGHPEDN